MTYFPKIIYEDNHILVVNKPMNIPTQGDSSGDLDMCNILKSYIKEKYNKPGNVYLGLVHRLDRPVGGVMVFAKTSKAAERLTNAFKTKGANGVVKKYIAITKNTPESSQHIECFLKKDELTHSAVVCKENDLGAKNASLFIQPLTTINNLTLSDITLNTGRHHQIRAQLSYIGCPIFGDHRYNPEFFDDTKANIALFAYSLELPHPTTHERMRFTAFPDLKDSSNKAWTAFSEYITALVCNTIPLHIDNEMIIVDKPVGIEVVDEKNEGDTLTNRLKIGFSEIYPVHRLDATTRGLTVFARNISSKTKLEKAFSHSESSEISVRKYYIAVLVKEPFKKEDTLKAYLIKDDTNSKVSVFDKKQENSKEIITKYRLIPDKQAKKFGVDVPFGTFAVEVELLTGRTHQIRAHFAHIGCPLLGDDKYGIREINKKHKITTPCLLAYKLSFADKTGNMEINIH